MAECGAIDSPSRCVLA